MILLSGEEIQTIKKGGGGSFDQYMYTPGGKGRKVRCRGGGTSAGS